MEVREDITKIQVIRRERLVHGVVVRGTSGERGNNSADVEKSKTADSKLITFGKIKMKNIFDISVCSSCSYIDTFFLEHISLLSFLQLMINIDKCCNEICIIGQKRPKDNIFEKIEILPTIVKYFSFLFTLLPF